MPVILPKHLKGLTSGMAKEIALHGHTTANGGRYSMDMLEGCLATAKISDYKHKREPLGIFMNTANNTVKEINEVAEAVSAAVKQMVAATNDANKQMTESTAKMRDNSEKLGAAITKLAKITGDKNFASTAATAASLVNSLERLSELEKTGMLDKVMKAMSK